MTVIIIIIPLPPCLGEAVSPGDVEGQQPGLDILEDRDCFPVGEALDAEAIDRKDLITCTVRWGVYKLVKIIKIKSGSSS